MRGAAAWKRYYIDLTYSLVEHVCTLSPMQASGYCYKINLPPLPTQHKIAAILSAYDDLIENNTRRIKILEEMAQALYREWFVNFRFPGHEKVPMVDSPLGEIPEGWEVKKLKEICEQIDYGYTASSDQEPIGPKFLRITDIVPYMIDWDSVPYCEMPGDKLKKYQLSEGDIVIARTGATTGYAKRINKKHPESIFASYLVRVRIKDEYDNNYVGLVVESDEYKRFIKANISGAAQPQANAQVLSSFFMLLPSKEIKERFRQNIECIFDQREILQEKNASLCRTRDLLLPKLISGELDVDTLDIKTEGMTS
jgi:type I restriction enzyme, S subunit